MNSTVTNERDPGPWPLIAKITAGAWMIVVLVFVARAAIKAPSFEDATKEPCTQLLVPVFEPFEQLVFNIDRNRFPQLLYWKDRLSGDEILPYRRGLKVLSCDSLDHYVAMFADAGSKGRIEPAVAVNWVRLILIIFVPSLLIFVFCYLMGGRLRKPKKPVPRIS